MSETSCEIVIGDFVYLLCAVALIAFGYVIGRLGFLEKWNRRK